MSCFEIFDKEKMDRSVYQQRNSESRYCHYSCGKAIRPTIFLTGFPAFRLYRHSRFLIFHQLWILNAAACGRRAAVLFRSSRSKESLTGVFINNEQANLFYYEQHIHSGTTYKWKGKIYFSLTAQNYWSNLKTQRNPKPHAATFDKQISAL